MAQRFSIAQQLAQAASAEQVSRLSPEQRTAINVHFNSGIGTGTGAITNTHINWVNHGRFSNTATPSAFKGQLPTSTFERLREDVAANPELFQQGPVTHEEMVEAARNGNLTHSIDGLTPGAGSNEISELAGTHAGLTDGTQHILELLGTGKAGRENQLRFNDFSDEEINAMYVQLVGHGVSEEELNKLRFTNDSVIGWVQGLTNPGGELSVFRELAEAGDGTPLSSILTIDDQIQAYDTLISNVNNWRESIEHKGELNEFAEKGGIAGRLADVTGIDEFQTVPAKVIPDEFAMILDANTAGVGSTILMGTEGKRKADSAVTALGENLTDLTSIQEFEEEIQPAKVDRNRAIAVQVAGAVLAPITFGLSAVGAAALNAFHANALGQLDLSDAWEATAWSVGSAAAGGLAGPAGSAAFTGFQSYQENGSWEDALRDASFAYAGSQVGDPRISTAINATGTYIKTDGDWQAVAVSAAQNYGANLLTGRSMKVDPVTGKAADKTTEGAIPRWKYESENRPVNPETGDAVPVGTKGAIPIAEYRANQGYLNNFLTTPDGRSVFEGNKKLKKSLSNYLDKVFGGGTTNAPNAQKNSLSNLERFYATRPTDGPLENIQDQMRRNAFEGLHTNDNGRFFRKNPTNVFGGEAFDTFDAASIRIEAARAG